MAGLLLLIRQTVEDVLDKRDKHTQKEQGESAGPSRSA
jgi:hypothetical protein